MHYGIENVKGSQFRRVTLENTARYGLLGKGAILNLTANPNRTSPVLRGAWILDRLLGTPPSPPPPNVPTLAENRPGQKAQTVRERMEQHRSKPTCMGCHGVMDPLGFALENFDTVGQYHAHDPQTLTLIDTSGVLPDGTPIKGPDDLRRALVARPDQFVQAFTENLLTYALGRSVDYRDMPAVRKIVRGAEGGRLPFRVDRPRNYFKRCFPQTGSPERKPASSQKCRRVKIVRQSRLEECSHVSYPKTFVATHPAERRRRFDRLAVAGCHDPGRYGAGADRRSTQPAPGLRLLSPWRPSGRMAAQAGPAAISSFHSS